MHESLNDGLLHSDHKVPLGQLDDQLFRHKGLSVHILFPVE